MNSPPLLSFENVLNVNTLPGGPRGLKIFESASLRTLAPPSLWEKVTKSRVIAKYATKP